MNDSPQCLSVKVGGEAAFKKTWMDLLDLHIDLHTDHNKDLPVKPRESVLQPECSDEAS